MLQSMAIKVYSNESLPTVPMIMIAVGREIILIFVVVSLNYSVSILWEFFSALLALKMILTTTVFLGMKMGF